MFMHTPDQCKLQCLFCTQFMKSTVTLHQVKETIHSASSQTLSIPNVQRFTQANMCLFLRALSRYKLNYNLLCIHTADCYAGDTLL